MKRKHKAHVNMHANKIFEIKTVIKQSDEIR